MENKSYLGNLVSYVASLEKKVELYENKINDLVVENERLKLANEMLTKKNLYVKPTYLAALRSSYQELRQRLKR